VAVRFTANFQTNLEQHPRIGRKFFARSAQSLEVREYQSGVYLLAIKHHRQLSFDFDGFWRANRGEQR
jgi:hypothetical protein